VCKNKTLNPLFGSEVVRFSTEFLTGLWGMRKDLVSLSKLNTMKKSYFISVIFIFAINFHSYSQQIMTLGEIYDFNIGDIFEYKRHGNGTPPNNQRVTITNKYTTTDTVFYGRLRESYGVIYVPTPTPHADTVFVTSNDTIYYTNLNVLITDYDSYFIYDTTIYYPEDYCGILINAHLGMTDTTTFEPPTVDREYGRGLGLVNSLDIWADNGGEPYGFYMTYYKKGIIECGISDPLTVSINSTNAYTPYLNIYPNPTPSTLTIQNASGLYHLTDITGKTLLSGLASGETFTLDISALSSGVYFLTLSEDGQQVVRKVIKQ
jgi:hypothetical protein